PVVPAFADSVSRAVSRKWPAGVSRSVYSCEANRWMKRVFCKPRTPTSKAQTGTKHVLQAPRAWRRHEKHSQSHARAFQTGATSFNGLEDVGGGFRAWLCAEISLAMDPDADGIDFMSRFPITNMVCTFICPARATAE